LESMVRLMTLRIISTVFCCCSFIACGDPGIEVTGRITDGDDKPINGAFVSVDCTDQDGRSRKGSETADEAGDFSLFLGLGCLPKDCVVEVSDTQTIQKFKAGERCHHAMTACKNACNTVTIDAKFE
jgi:hypothetical protein